MTLLEPVPRSAATAKASTASAKGSCASRAGPTSTPDAMSFLLEGSMARAGLEGDLGPLGEAREIAAQLVGA